LIHRLKSLGYDREGGLLVNIDELNRIDVKIFTLEMYLFGESNTYYKSNSHETFSNFGDTTRKASH
jgi:hypothetical protein